MSPMTTTSGKNSAQRTCPVALAVGHSPCPVLKKRFPQEHVEVHGCGLTKYKLQVRTRKMQIAIGRDVIEQGKKSLTASLRTNRELVPGIQE